MSIKIYGDDWCSDCLVIKKILDDYNIAYEYIMISKNKEAVKFVEKINNGKRIIPTIDINGKILINPGINKLMKIIKE